LQSRITDILATDGRVIAISPDSVEKNAGVVDKLQLDYSILSDPDLAVIDSFGLRHESGNPMEGKDIARPAVFVLNRDGTVHWRALTDNWRIRVRPETILEQLAAIP